MTKSDSSDFPLYDDISAYFYYGVFVELWKLDLMNKFELYVPFLDVIEVNCSQYSTLLHLYTVKTAPLVVSRISHMLVYIRNPQKFLIVRGC